MNGEHRSILVLMNLWLSPCGRVVINNTHCRNWPGDVHVGNEQPCIIHSDADGQLVILRRC